MKKGIIVFAILMCVLTSFGSVFAEEQPTIIVSEEEGFAGETVDVTVSLANNPGIISMLLNVKYDTEILALKKVTDSGKLPGAMHTSDYTLNPYPLYWDNGSAQSDYYVNDRLVTMTFEIKENATPGVCDIEVFYDLENFDIINFDLDPVYFAVQNGYVRVKDPQSFDGRQLTVSNLEDGDILSFTCNLTPEESVTGTVIVALYDNNTMKHIEMYDANDTVDIRMNKQGATRCKVFWWNKQTIEPYSDACSFNLK